ncbi:hypothetical protein [Sphingomonas sp. PP-CE-1G-424]|uniref:hypothetical protein n=1 Tax=Sphingomonas sp. PP-CE-1G-424 TaxID=2135658 RepID=UPI0010E30A47|nr:hypothetical protein [Sphingomonas sp. PP-CE-1G-424]TCP65847.1 hypothetical protein C8J43_10851 [Sphingomonas sp. PP-CE-1G-424]
MSDNDVQFGNMRAGRQEDRTEFDGRFVLGHRLDLARRVVLQLALVVENVACHRDLLDGTHDVDAVQRFGLAPVPPSGG